MASTSSSSLLSSATSLVSSLTSTDTRRVRIRPKAGMSSLISTASSITSDVQTALLGNSSNNNILQPLVATNGLMFPYTPNISWTQQIEYGNQSLVHTNQDFRYFIKGKSASFTITGDFTSENSTNALYTLACLHFLKTVTKMHFGETDANRGLPPPMMVLSGYGPYMMSNIPVIIESFSMNWPQDVDYVSVTVGGYQNWIPVTTQITVQCTYQQTPQAATQFNYSSYASGKLLQQGGIF